MSLEIRKHIAAIYGIIFIAFTAVMVLLWNQKDFAFWCFYFSTVLVLANLFFLHCCTAGDREGHLAIINLSLFIPPALSYVAICAVTWFSTVKGSGAYKGYLAMDIVIFALSVIGQICLFHVRKGIARQEKEIRLAGSGEEDRTKAHP